MTFISSKTICVLLELCGADASAQDLTWEYSPCPVMVLVSLYLPGLYHLDDQTQFQSGGFTSSHKGQPDQQQLVAFLTPLLAFQCLFRPKLFIWSPSPCPSSLVLRENWEPLPRSLARCLQQGSIAWGTSQCQTFACLLYQAL